MKVSISNSYCVRPTEFSVVQSFGDDCLVDVIDLEKLLDTLHRHTEFDYLSNDVWQCHQRILHLKVLRVPLSTFRRLKTVITV